MRLRLRTETGYFDYNVRGKAHVERAVSPVLQERRDIEKLHRTSFEQDRRDVPRIPVNAYCMTIFPITGTGRGPWSSTRSWNLSMSKLLPDFA